MKKTNRKHKTRAGSLALACAAVLLATAMLATADADDQYSAWSTPVDLGATVNSLYFDQQPVISKDGLSLYFHSNRPGGFGGADIYVSQRPSVDAPWGTPQNLGPTVNTPFTEAAPALSPDGHRLYFHSNRPGGFGGADIYVSRRHNKRDDFGWQPAENLGSGVNTASQEQQASVFEDDSTGIITLFFNSNRPGGLGGDDIYASELQSDETFGTAALVVELSSAANDSGPAVRRDGLEIYFASDRPGTLGYDDLWVSTRPSTADPWSTPVNLGPGINSPFIDGGPALSFDGTALYFNSSPPPRTVPTRLVLWVTTRTKLKGQD